LPFNKIKGRTRLVHLSNIIAKLSIYCLQSFSALTFKAHNDMSGGVQSLWFPTDIWYTAQPLWPYTWLQFNGSNYQIKHGLLKAYYVNQLKGLRGSFSASSRVHQ